MELNRQEYLYHNIHPFVRDEFTQIPPNFLPSVQPVLSAQKVRVGRLNPTRPTQTKTKNIPHNTTLARKHAYTLLRRLARTGRRRFGPRPPCRFAVCRV